MYMCPQNAQNNQNNSDENKDIAAKFNRIAADLSDLSTLGNPTPGPRDYALSEDNEDFIPPPAAPLKLPRLPVAICLASWTILLVTVIFLAIAQLATPLWLKIALCVLLISGIGSLLWSLRGRPRENDGAVV